ncbi:MAG: D-erythronate dehydrogenase [Pseudomonadota bacterium]
MKVLICGGGGMLGQKLALHVAQNGLGDAPAATLSLHDIDFPTWTSTGAPAQIAGDLSDPSRAPMLIRNRPDVVFHLAAVVSGEAEADFDKGWRVNMTGTWQLLEALRAAHLASGGSYRPRVVFTSSIAVFGGPYPDRIDDEFLSAPQTSYGAQKVVGEMMIADFTRKGFIDGLSIRLPTICVRPGRPNQAASSFFSAIIREPLNGREATLPVPETVRHWHASPQAAVGFLTHAATLDTDRLNGRRALNLPGVSCTVAEQIEALRAIAGNDAVARIKRRPDRTIMRIVEGWPRDFSTDRALALGFAAEPDFETIVRTYIAHDLPNA